jgi:hypothetical protein
MITEATANLHSVIAGWIQALGVVVASVAFLYTLFRNRRQWAVERYEDLAGKWIEFLRTCREHPDLELGPLDTQSANAEDARVERVTNSAFLELLVVLERMFVLESVSVSPARIAPGAFKEVIGIYARREPFLAVWGKARGWHDRRFTAFVDEIVEDSRRAIRESETLTAEHLTPMRPPFVNSYRPSQSDFLWSAPVQELRQPAQRPCLLSFWSAQPPAPNTYRGSAVAGCGGATAFGRCVLETFLCPHTVPFKRVTSSVKREPALPGVSYLRARGRGRRCCSNCCSRFL